MPSTFAPVRGRRITRPILQKPVRRSWMRRWILPLFLCGAAYLYSYYSGQGALNDELQKSKDRITQLTEALEAAELSKGTLSSKLVGSQLRASEYLERDPKTMLEVLHDTLALEGISSEQKAEIEQRIESIPDAISLPDGFTLSGAVTAASTNYCAIEVESSLVNQALRRDQFVLSQASKRLHHVTLYELDQRATAARHVLLLIDQSGSTKEVMPEVKRATAGFVQGLTEVANVKLAAFNDRLQPLTQWTLSGAELATAVQQLRADGGTALRDSMLEVIRELSTKPGTKTIIVLSDGRDSKENADFEAVTKAAMSGGVEITTIAINTPQDHTELLRSLALKTGGMSFGLNNIAELKSHFDSIARKLKTKRYRFVVLDPLDVSIPITIEANNGHVLQLKVPS